MVINILINKEFLGMMQCCHFSFTVVLMLLLLIYEQVCSVANSKWIELFIYVLLLLLLVNLFMKFGRVQQSTSLPTQFIGIYLFAARS